MRHFTYETEGTCSVQIDFDIDDDNTIHNIEYLGGCNGNLKGISRAMEGKTADEIYDLFHGITCGYKPTSCPDQLATAVLKAQEQNN